MQNTNRLAQYFVSLIILVGALALGIGLSLWLTADRASAPLPELRYGTALPEAQPLDDFTLVDHHGQAFDRSRLTGQWTLAFFGFTNCPDVCPTTLAVLDDVKQRLAQQGYEDQLQVAFVSVDPARDTPAQVAAYMNHFNPEFVGVTGELEQIRRLTRQVGIVFVHEQGKVEGAYDVHHSAAVLLFDPQGRWSALFSSPHYGEDMSQDMLTILQHYEG
ncbi:SCO family protein [Ectothiorhodospiraceae bacterium 2226]|nr:SCO family protein [Ectothiorhodospiraceae bacterium 2226]